MESSVGVAGIVRAAAGGDEQAWCRLVDALSGLVWAVARRHGLNPEDSADLVQTVWLRVVDNLDRIEAPERLAGWLATTARREALRTIRLRRRQIPTEADDPTFVDLTFDEAAETRLLADERRREVAGLLDSMPEQSRRVLRMLMADDGLSYRELSRHLDMPIGSIGPTRRRGLELLRRRLAETDGSAVVEPA